MNFGVINTRDCVTIPPPIDQRCLDPAFAIANPDICGTATLTRLIIKPGQGLICQLGSINFSAVLVSNGVETDVTNQTTFTSSDMNVALIGAATGRCTGLNAGECTITASYLNFTAMAKLTVMAGDNCCSQMTVAMLVVVDTTYSMAQAFGGTYTTKLDYARAAANRFISEVNPHKDMVGLSAMHGTSYNILADISSNVASVAAQTNLLQQTQDKTEFFDAFTQAIAQLNNTIADRKVLILISDGNDTLTSNWTTANDPIVLSQAFQQQGGTVICFGVRAANNGFKLLEALATGGFFINAYPSNAAQSLNYLSGLKGYICAGNCVPTGDQVVHKGQLNYNTFQNWNVLNGWVDLQGNDFFDYLSGNGLYVDLIAGTQPSGNENGMLSSKTPFALNSGDTYRLSVRLAGNQVVSRPADAVHLQVYYINSSGTQVLLDQIVPVPNYLQAFQVYSFSFTAPVNCNAYITVQQANAPAPDPSGDYRAGVLLDLVQLDDVTNLNTLIADNFDEENPVYIPPACGTGTTYVFLPDLNRYGYESGYNCYGYGCLDEPPGVQSPDPNPQGDVETGGAPPPTTYSSTQQACASCPTGSVNLSWDLTAASASSSNGVPIVPQQNINPPWCSNTFPAWIQYVFAAPTTVAAYLLYQAYGRHPGDVSQRPINVQLQGSNDGVTWTVLDTRTGIQPITSLAFPVQTPGAYTFYRVYFTQFSDNNTICLTNVLFSDGLPVQQCATASATSQISQGDADSKASSAALAAAQAMLTCQTIYTSTQQYTACCPAGTLGNPNCVTRSATVTSYNSQAEADAQALAEAQAAAQAALNCTGSNNTQAITINDSNTPPTEATPYPSVAYQTGAPASLSKVTVTLHGFQHTSPPDVLILLEGPDGTTCELMRHCGQTVIPVGPIDITFDDAAATNLPSGSTFGAGTYKPSQYGVVLAYPAPAPQPAYGTTLSVFNGKNGNGSWALWVIDSLPFNAGQITNGWTIALS